MENLSLKFEGKDLGHSVDAFDLASSIIAFGRIIEDIAILNFLGKDQKIKINVNAFKEGSFSTGFEIDIVSAIAYTKTFIDGGGVDLVKNLINTFKEIVEIKKFLQGKKPKRVEVNNNVHHNQNVTIYNFKGDNMIVDLSAFRSLQEEKINKNLQKMTESIGKNELIEDIKIEGNDIETIVISQSEVPYFEPLEDAQITPEHRVKGIVSKLDTKTESGFLTVGSKRISFSYATVKGDKKQEIFLTLIESMKNRIAIFLIGSATFDLESELKKIDIKDVQSDAKLF